MKNKVMLLMFLFIPFLSACTAPTAEKNIVETPFDHSSTLYIQDGCGHCQIVETYLEQNKASGISDSFQTKDIGKDKLALNSAVETAKICGIPDGELGTPLFYDGSKCYMGSDDVINYLSSKIK
jgi:glutaredoxin